MTLLLRCGCTVPFSEQAPICPSHGNQAVVRVFGVPAPRIRGVASGPHVTTVDLDPFVGPIPGVEKDA